MQIRVIWEKDINWDIISIMLAHENVVLIVNWCRQDQRIVGGNITWASDPSHIRKVNHSSTFLTMLCLWKELYQEVGWFLTAWEISMQITIMTVGFTFPLTIYDLKKDGHWFYIHSINLCLFIGESRPLMLREEQYF